MSSVGGAPFIYTKTSKFIENIYSFYSTLRDIIRAQGSNFVFDFYEYFKSYLISTTTSIIMLQYIITWGWL